jgi:hypothetical protein
MALLHRHGDQLCRPSQLVDRGAIHPARQLFGYRTMWDMILGFFRLSFVLYFFITRSPVIPRCCSKDP